MMMFSRRTLVPMTLTMAALIAGFLSILRSATGNYVEAAQLILLSLVLDGLDGKLARVMRGESAIGAELDTYVDFCSFGVAPAVLIYLSVLRDFDIFGLFGPGLAGFMVLSGGLRLSRFRVIDPHRGEQGYAGLPITVAGGWAAVWVYLEESGALRGAEMTIAQGPLAAFVWACTLLFVSLQISRVHYPKATKDAVVFAGGVLLVVALLLGVQMGPAAALGLAAYGFFYACVTPFLLRRRNPVSPPAEAPAISEAADADEEAEEEAEADEILPFRRP